MNLKDQAIIVTGGASGIGYHASLALAAHGANIIVADFNLEGATKVAAELQKLGVRAFPYRVDVSKAADVEALVDFSVEKLSTLNGIFNNAGIGLVKPFLEMDPATYHKVIEVDQHSVYYGMYYAAKKMVALGAKGTFVNTASIYGVTKADRAGAGRQRGRIPLHRGCLGHQWFDHSGRGRVPDLQEQLNARTNACSLQPPKGQKTWDLGKRAWRPIAAVRAAAQTALRSRDGRVKAAEPSATTPSRPTTDEHPTSVRALDRLVDRPRPGGESHRAVGAVV